MTYDERVSVSIWIVMLLVAVRLFLPWEAIGAWIHRTMKGLRTGNWKAL